MRVFRRTSFYKVGIVMVLLIAGLCRLFLAADVFAATRTWDGGGTTNNWSDCVNWSLDTCPTTADIVTFDTTSTKDATIDSGFTTGVTTFNINAGYTGTITQARSFTVSGVTTFAGAAVFNGSTDALTFTGAYTQSAGTFTGGNQTVTHTGAFTLSGVGASYTASIGTTIFSNNFTHTAGTGTFSQASGSVSITGGSTRTFDFATTESFNNVTLNKTTATSLTIASGDTMVVTGTSTLTDGNLTTGTWDARGTTSWAATFDGGTGTLLLGGSAVVAATLNSGNTAVNLSITNANVTVDTAGTGTVAVGALTMSAGILNANAATMTYSGAVALSGGTYNAPTSGAGTTTFSSTFDQTTNGVFVGGVNAVTHTGAFTLSGAGATYTATSGTTTFSAGFTHTAGTGTFTHNNGSVKFSGLASTTNVATTETFNNLELAKNNAVLLTVSSGDTLITTGTLTLTNGGFTTGTVEATSTISLNSGWDGGGGTLLIDGVNTQNLPLNGGGAALASTVTLNNANFTFSGTGAGTLTFSAVNLQAGTIDATGYSMTFGGAYNQSGGTFTGGSGTVNHSTFTLSNGTYTATSGTTNISTTWTHTAGTFNHGSGTISSTGGTFTMTIVDQDAFYNATFTVTNGNTRTISGGTLIVAHTFYFSSGGGALTGTFDLRGDITGGGTTFPGTRTVSITGTADQTWSIPSGFGGTFTVNKSTGSVTQSTAVTTGAFTFTDGTWNTSDLGFSTASTLTLNGGTLNFGASTVSLASVVIAGGTFNASTATTTVTGSWTHTAGGTFNHDNGTVSFTAGTSTIDVASTETFFTVSISVNNGNTKTIANSDGLIVLGNLTLTGGGGDLAQTTKPAAGTLQLYGNLTVNAGIASTTGTFGFYGSGTQHFTEASAKAMGNWTIDKTGGSVILDSTLDDGSTQTVTVTNGTLDLNGNTISMNAASSKLIINAGGTLKLQGGETITTTGASYPQWDAGSTIYYYGTGAAYTLKNYSGYKNVVLDGTAATTVFTLPATTSIAENLTITNGILSLATFGLTVTGTFSNNDTVKLVGSETISLTQDANSGTWRYLGDGDAAADTYTLKDFGVTDYYNLEIATTDAADIVQSAGAKVFAGTLTVSSGAYDANGQTTATTGLATLSGGTYTGSTATQTFDAGLTLSGGTYTGSSGTADVNGTLTLTTGTFTAPTSTTISGNFVKGAATFTHNSGTVTFDANANHSITGSPSWNSLTLQDSSDNATDVVLTVEAGSTQTINGTLTLDGLDASDRLNIVSSSPTTASTFDFEGTSAFSGDYLDITDSIVTDNSSGVSAPINPANTVDGGNTTNWFAVATPGVTVSAISGNTTEAGGTATFTVVLDSQPTNDVVIGISSSDTTEGTVSAASLTFTNANYATPQTITVTGVNDDLDDGDVAYNVVTAAATSADGNYNGINPADVAVTNTDNDTSGFTVSTISGNTTEAGGTATFTVVLTAQPTADVSTGISSNDATEGTVSTASLTFTTANWSTPQTVTVTGVNDDLDDGDVAYNAVIAAATSADILYNGINPSDVSVTNTDNDTSGFTVSTISGNTTEAGGTATATIVLTAQPTADVTVDITSSDTTEGAVSPASVTFTSGNWSTPQTITATGVNDDVDDGDIAYSIVTAAATSADTNYNAINPADVAVTNTDNDTAGFTVTESGGTTAITEGGATDSFTIVLGTQPTSNVVFDVTSNDTTSATVSAATFTFTTVNWATPQTVTVTAPEDADTVSETPTITIAVQDVSSDDVYDPLANQTVSVAVTDNDTVGITVSTISGNTTEAGRAATFTVVLTSEPSADVTIGISSNDTTEGTVSAAILTFTSLNYATPQTITVTGVNDDVDDGDIAYSIVTAAAISVDADYNTLNASDVSVTNTDDDTAAVTVSAISGNTTEAGGTATFTLVLTTQPTGNVVITSASGTGTEGAVTSGGTATFTTVNWATPQTVTVTGQDDDLDDGDTAYTIVVVMDALNTVDATYGAINPSDVSVTNTDNDTAGVTVSVISGNTTEAGGTATCTVVLNSQPTGTVTIGVSSDDTTEGTVSTALLTFTTGNWATPQTVTVTGVNDDVDDGDIAYSVVTAAASSSDTNYNGVNPGDVSVTNTDNDTLGVTVSAISGNTTETSTTATFTVVLNTQPTGNVEVDAVTDNSAEGVVTEGNALTFTTLNWSTPQTVTVAGQDDAIDDGDIVYHIVMTVNASATADNAYDVVDPSDITVTNTDNDTLGVTVSAISGATTEAGGTATFSVVLNTQPVADVVIGISSSDATEGTVLPSSLTFTGINWASTQIVTVTGVNDDVDDGDVTYSIVTAAVSSLDSSYNGVNPSDVSVTNTDDDTFGITVSAISGATTEAGGTATFTVVLQSQPTADVAIGLTSSNTAEGAVSAATLTFTALNWSTPQTVTVTGQDDSVDDGDIAYTIVTAAASSADTNYSALNAGDVSATNTDNDTAGITITESSSTTNVTEGGDFDAYAVVLTSKPTASVTVTAVPDSELSANLSSVTFTVDNWDTPQVIVISAVDDAAVESTEVHTVVHIATSADSVYNNFTVATVFVTVTDNDTSGGSGDSGGGGAGGSSDSSVMVSITAPATGRTYSTATPITVSWRYTGTIPAVNVYISRDSGATWTILRYAETNDGSTTIGPITDAGQALIKVDGTNYISILATDTAGPIIFSDAAAPNDVINDGTSSSDTSGTTSASGDTADTVAARVSALPASITVHELVKLADDGDTTTAYDSVVYYIGADGRRHAFPNGKIFLSWYCDFSTVQTVTPDALTQVPLGRNVTYRPGYRMVKFQTDPRVFAVDSDGRLRWVLDEATATALYGAEWNKKIDDISDAFYPNYVFGDILSDTAWDALAQFSSVAAPSDIMSIPGYTPESGGAYCPSEIGTAPDAISTSDADGDGLTNAEELALRTNPLLRDSDADGLSDGDEINIYITDPSNLDTDGDGYLDGEEVINGHNPKGA